MDRKNNTESNIVPFVAPGAVHIAAIRPLPQSDMGPVSEREITFADLYHALIQRWKLIAGVTAACMTIMSIFCMTRDPLYSARSTIEIRGYAPILAGATIENLLGADTRKAEYQKTTIAKLKQLGIADRVLSQSDKAKEIASYFGFDLRPASTDGNPSHTLQQAPKLLALYLSTININPVSETSLTQIDVTTKDPQLSMIIANAHAEGFIETLRVERQESMKTNLKALEAQTEELKSKLSSAEEEIAVYSEQNHLILTSTADSKDVNLQKIVALSGLLSQSTTKRVQSENLYNQLKDAPSLGSSSLDNESIQQWRFELNKLESDYKSLGQRVTEEYPEMIDIKSKMSSLQKSIASERTQQLEALARSVESEKAGEQRLIEQIEAVESQVHGNLKKMARFTVLRKEADSLRELYENVLKQLQETTVSAASGVSNIYVSDWASIPQSPSFPKTGLMMVIAAVVGIGLGIFSAWALEFFDNRVKSADDASIITSLPLLGMIPSFGDSSSRRKIPPLKLIAARLKRATESDKTPPTTEQPSAPVVKSQLALNSIPPVVSEALRTIRAGLLLSSVDAPMKTILVTSSDKGEGKTTVAANLAVSLAQAEYRTLLVDADLRQPSVSRFFPLIADRAGLSDQIAGQADMGSTIVRNVIPFLDVIGSGSRPPNPAELVGSRRMSDTLAAFRANYDFVIVDSPPVMPVADSLMLSNIVDGIILVVRGGKSLRRNLKETKRRLSRVRANLVGIIVNDARAAHQQTYGHGHDANTVYFSPVDQGISIEPGARPEQPQA